MLTQLDIEFAHRIVALGFIDVEQMRLYMQALQQRTEKVSLKEFLIAQRLLSHTQVAKIESLNQKQTQIQATPEKPVALENIGTFSFDSKNIKEQFLHYKIEKELGRGGMGVVYKAFDTKLQRVVALKLLLAKNAGEQEIKRHFQETKTIAQLNHPNIIRLLEVGEHPSHYFTMEYIEGKTFGDWSRKRVSPKDIAITIEKVAQALEQAHSQGIIHRDIKPSNIMIDKNNKPVVMDFGLAKDIISDVKISKTGDLIGTPAYMSPEQVNNQKVGALSDIYSLGATLYEGLTKRAPFEGAAYFNVVSQILHKDAISPRNLNPDIPIELEAICCKCLSKNPGHRYGSAFELAKDLNNFLHGRPILAHPITKFTQFRKFLWRYKIICIAVTLLFLCFAAFGYIYNQRILEERNHSFLVAQNALKNLSSIYTKHSYLYQDPSLLEGLKTSLEEMERLQILDKFFSGESETDVFKLLSNVYFRASAPKEISKGIEVFTELIKKYPHQKNLHKAYNIRANLYRKQKKYQKALLDTKKALSLKPEIHYYVNLGHLYEQANQKVLAENFYSKAIELDAKNNSSYRARGAFFLKQKRYKEALRDLLKALELNPKSFLSNRELAYLYFEQKQYSKALAHCNKILLDIKPRDIETLKIRAVTYFETKQYNKALQDFGLYLEINPKSPDTHEYCARAYAKKEMHMEALRHFNKAISLDPKYMATYSRRASSYIALKKYQKAEQDYSKILSLKPKNAEIYFRRGNTFIYRDLYKKAMLDYYKSIEINPKHRYVYNNLGACLLKTGELKKALKMLSKAQIYNPKNSNIYFNRGKIYRRLKLYSKALDEFQKALRSGSSKKALLQKWIGELRSKTKRDKY